MRAIICSTVEEWQALELKVYSGMIDDKVIVSSPDEEGNEVLSQTYSSIRINPKTPEIAFDVKPEAEKYLTEDELAECKELTWDWFCGRNLIKGHSTLQFYCEYNDDFSVVKFGTTPIGKTTTSGMKNLIAADTEEELEVKVDTLLGEGFYSEHKTEN